MRAIAVAFATLCSFPALAQDSAFDLSANVSVVSDYRFRGISLSDRDPALQGGLDLSHSSGLFVGTWATSIADYGGAETEVDIYGGYSGSVGDTSYTLTAIAYLYPGGANLDFVELQADVAREFGPVTLTGTLAYTPEQKNVGDLDNVYVGGKAEHTLEALPATLFARGGYEDGFYDSKLDWEVGAVVEQGPFALSASVVGTDYSGENEAGKLGKITFLVGLTATF